MLQMVARSETAPTQSRGKHAVWRDLQHHYAVMQGLHLRSLFADDPARGERMTAEAAGVYLDYSKNRITDETLKLLTELAEQSALRARIDAMFRGEKLNVTENRAVLPVTLRAPKGAFIIVDGKNVVPEVHAVLGKMTDPAAANGKATPANPSAMSSISALAAPILDRDGIRGAQVL
jgi:glucose-6-phosphate isomerase